MKTILSLICITTLLTTSGCIVAEGGRHEHAHYEHHDDVMVGPPAVIVRAPEVVLPAVRVHVD